MILRLVNISLRVLLGLVFIASAVLKLFPIEAFEYNFVSIGVANWTTAPFIARLLIGSEFVLGALLIFNIWLQRVTIPLVLAMLFAFTVYLVYQLFTEGNDVNCGCFGTYLEMTPLESIVKNVMMASITVWLRITKKQLTLPKLPWLLSDRITGPVLTVVLMVLPFVLNPVGAGPSEPHGSERVGQTLNMELLYGPDNPNPPAVDLRKGRYVLAMFSLKCPHCKVAALKMNVMHRRHPQLPFYFILRGNTETRLKPFLAESQYFDVPYAIYNSDDFFVLSAQAVPAIYRLQDGVVVKAESEFTLDESELLEWIAQNE